MKSPDSYTKEDFPHKRGFYWIHVPKIAHSIYTQGASEIARPQGTFIAYFCQKAFDQILESERPFLLGAVRRHILYDELGPLEAYQKAYDDLLEQEELTDWEADFLETYRREDISPIIYNKTEFYNLNLLVFWDHDYEFNAKELSEDHKEILLRHIGGRIVGYKNNFGPVQYVSANYSKENYYAQINLLNLIQNYEGFQWEKVELFLPKREKTFIQRE